MAKTITRELSLDLAQARLEKTGEALRDVLRREADAIAALNSRTMPADERTQKILNRPDEREKAIKAAEQADARQAFDLAVDAERHAQDADHMKLVKAHAPGLYKDMIALLDKHKPFAEASSRYFDQASGSRPFVERFDAPLVQLRILADVYREGLKGYGIDL